MVRDLLDMTLLGMTLDGTDFDFFLTRLAPFDRLLELRLADALNEKPCDVTGHEPPKLNTVRSAPCSNWCISGAMSGATGTELLFLLKSCLLGLGTPSLVGVLGTQALLEVLWTPSLVDVLVLSSDSMRLCSCSEAASCVLGNCSEPSV